jgi:hypothetical protein
MVRGILLALFLWASSAAAWQAKLEMRGVYGHPSAFWKTGATLGEYGIDSVFVHAGSINAELVERVRREGAKLYAEFPTLNGRGYVDKHPEAWPIDAAGQKAPPATWFMGACPTEPNFRAYRMKQLSDLLERYELAGVFMDYLHWHAQFEEPEPVLPETCFSPTCLRDFSRATGIRIPGGDTAAQAKFILERHDREWRDWRTSVIAGWMKEIRAIIEAKRPGIVLGNYQCPWRDDEFGGARRRTLGLDLDVIAPLVDVMSPMVYHQRMGRPPAWVGESVEWLARRVGAAPGRKPAIWTIVQAHGQPEPIPAGEFAQVLRLGASGGATGVKMFTTASIAQDPAKMKVLQAFYTGAPQSGLYGRWNLTVAGERGGHGGWLELTAADGRSGLRVVGRVGGARPVKSFDLREDGLRFINEEWFGRYEKVEYDLRLDGGRLAGSFTRENGERMTVEGVRAPALKREPPRAWGTPLPLFNGRDLTGWRTLTGRPGNWSAENGALVNAKSGQNLRTEAEFEDFQLRLEFNCPAGSNSGVFLRGRYEVQIESAPKKASVPRGSLGSIYGYIAPRAPVEDRPGEWRTLDVTLIGRTVTVRLDGVAIIQDEEIPGPTGGNFNSREGEPGPLILQGDHGQVSYRNIAIRPAVR